METIIRKMVYSTDSIIPLLKDQQNGFLVCFVVKEKVKFESTSSVILKVKRVVLCTLLLDKDHASSSVHLEINLPC